MTAIGSLRAPCDEEVLRRTKQHIELIPENPDFETIVVGPDEPGFALEGLAVGLNRNTMLM